jgi:hypothetical protein
VTKERLEQFCKERDIFVPAGATKAYLEAAIVRAFYNGHEPKNAKSCFGFWEHENNTCKVCDFEKECSTASLGMDKETYFKKLEAAENPKLRFSKSLRPSRFSRQPQGK